MRRSRSVSTLVFGAAALSLAACDDGAEEQVTLYPTIEACAAAEVPKEDCEAAFKQAQTEHFQAAPRFQDQPSCEAQVGQGACMPVQMQTPQGGMAQWFMPAMAGFMLARALDRDSSYYVGRGGVRYVSYPVYVGRDGYAYSRDRTIARLPTGQSTLSRSTTVSTTRSNAGFGTVASSPSTSRGGFGGTGSRASSSGG
ncbi:MAG TPA: DUF1190 domain-containing protein [Alphaproteobacteria bacterium]|nr:DUF1190 domain-containing protein [Alphaproteobacteria bacterium]